MWHLCGTFTRDIYAMFLIFTVPGNIKTKPVHAVALVHFIEMCIDFQLMRAKKIDDDLIVNE